MQSTPGRQYRRLAVHRHEMVVGTLMLLVLGGLGALLPRLDYRPLVWALQIELAGGSAFGPAMDAAFVQHYSGICADCIAGGFAYPLPAMWLALPVLGLPVRLANAVWCALSFGSVALGLRLLRVPGGLLLFVPLLWGTAELQVTVLLVGLVLIGIWALEARRWWLLGFVVALTIAAKPQTTLLLSAGLALGGLRGGAWRQLLLCGLVVLLPTFVLEPRWPLELFAAVGRYRGAISMIWLLGWLPLAVLLAALGRFWAALALAQICLFPLVAHGYALLPLLAGYAELRSQRLAWLAALYSWLMVLLLDLRPHWLLLGICYVVPLLLITWAGRPLSPARFPAARETVHS